MDPVTIVKLLTAGASFLEHMGPVLNDAVKVAQSSDHAEVKSALARFQTANDAHHNTVQARLRGD